MKSRVVFSRQSDEWSTPQWLFDYLSKTYGPFTLDPCATKENTKCEKYFTIEQDGLKQSWSGHRVFINPPYGNIKNWVKKCYEEATSSYYTTAIMLIPARTDTKYWHDYVMKSYQIGFVKGRLKFGDSENSAPFPSAIVHFSAGPFVLSSPQIYTIDAKEVKR